MTIPAIVLSVLTLWTARAATSSVFAVFHKQFQAGIKIVFYAQLAIIVGLFVLGGIVVPVVIASWDIVESSYGI
jgi:hypothetical protein